MISAFRRSPSSRRWSVLPAVLLVTVASCALTDQASSEGPATRPAATGEPRLTFTDAAPQAPAQAVPGEATGVNVNADAVRANQALDRRIPELNLDAKPFKEVIEELHKTADVDIVVNWRALEAAGIDREAPVTARLRNAKFEKVLRVVLDDVGGGTVKLVHTIDDGTLSITTEEDLNRNTITRVYDIHDLITEVPDYAPASETKVEAKPQPTTQPGPSLTEQMMILIQETVQPDAWRDAGGTVGSIRELAGQLIITATPQMHTQVDALLNQLREARGVQISVEARFLALDPNLLNKALGERLKDSIGKSGAATVWQLTDEQVQAVLRGAQESKQTTLVTAPRITLFNGQRAYVNVGTQKAYVSGYTVFKKEDNGETRYEPKVGIIDSGILLDVRATASADRRQAVLTIKPKISQLEDLRPEPYMGSKDLFIQVPQVVVHELQTTLTIPDRGTALIGGFVQTLNGEATTAGELVAQPGPVESEKRGKIVLNKMPPSQNVFLLIKPTLVISQAHAK